MNFEMGINAVVNCLTNITVQFKNGEPPQNAQNAVDVNVMNLNPPPFGVTTTAPFFQTGQNHGTIDGSTIDIDPTALGHSAVAPSFMKNLGAHEFGHALGLDEDPRQGGARTNVMDPDFNLIRNARQEVTGADPFVGLSARDKMMLRAHYAVVPEPAGLLLWGAATIGMLARRRRGGAAEVF